MKTKLCFSRNTFGFIVVNIYDKIISGHKKHLSAASNDFHKNGFSFTYKMYLKLDNKFYIQFIMFTATR